MQILFLIGAGGFLGSIARYAAQQSISRMLPVIFPYGTMAVNIAGSLLIGIIYALSDRTSVISPEWRFFLATGFCGGFTTFSAFSFEAYALLREEHYLYLFLYATLSTVLSILATWLAVFLVRSF
jgi:CrcB protein